MNPRTAAVLSTCQSFGLTKQASVAFVKQASPIDLGGDFDPIEDAKGVGAHAALSYVPFGSTLLGSLLADKAHEPKMDGALRAIAGNLGGSFAGWSLGRGLGNVLGLSLGPHLALRSAGSLLGGGLGGHLATRQYWIPSKSKSDE